WGRARARRGSRWARVSGQGGCRITAQVSRVRAARKSAKRTAEVLMQVGVVESVVVPLLDQLSHRLKPGRLVRLVQLREADSCLLNHARALRHLRGAVTRTS